MRRYRRCWNLSHSCCGLYSPRVAPVTEITGHPGVQTTAVMRAAGVDHLFTLNGAHIWPFYEGARDRGMRIVDTRHEATAVFAAEAWAKLTRGPGYAALTAGPGVTNGVSAITSAAFNGSPVVVVGGRAPQLRWGSGSLQEFDHVPVLAPIVKEARTVTDPATAADVMCDLVASAATPGRGPVFADFPLDTFQPHTVELDEQWWSQVDTGSEPDPEALAAAVAALSSSERPVMMVGSDAYWGDADVGILATATAWDVPCYANGLGRGVVPARHRLGFMRTRGLWRSRADLIVVVGAPLDFRLSFGDFGGTPVVHLVDHESKRASHVEGVVTVVGDISRSLMHLALEAPASMRRDEWVGEVRAAEDAAAAADRALLDDDHDPVRPGRVYGELQRRLADDAVVICDGGDFASYAGRLVEMSRPGCWLDTGPYGCLGNGLGYALAARLARPSSQVVLLLGDGAAGFSLMDVDTLVRHRLPVVMVVGNNSMWGLEKHPMQMIYGWDEACDLAPGTRYDEVVRSLGGDGETVTRHDQVGPALDRAFASSVPYLVNVLTDPNDVYPRTSNLA